MTNEGLSHLGDGGQPGAGCRDELEEAGFKTRTASARYKSACLRPRLMSAPGPVEKGPAGRQQLEQKVEIGHVAGQHRDAQLLRLKKQ
jgi:hypothetical protein